MTLTKQVKKELGLRYEPTAFINPASAREFAATCIKKCWVVMLGLENRFWVVCFADASRLQKAGFEFAPF